MELVDIDSEARTVYKQNTVPRTASNKNLKNISIFFFKYSPWICLAEGIIIFCTLTYLLSSTGNAPSDTQQLQPQQQQPQDQPQNRPPEASNQPSGSFSPQPAATAQSDLLPPSRLIFRTYSKVQLAPELALNCNQRKHDFPNGDECLSSRTAHCIQPKFREILKENEPNRWVVSSFKTSRAGHKFEPEIKVLEPGDSVECLNDNSWHDLCRHKTLLTIFLDQKHHKIAGWGGALTDSSIHNILSLTVNGTRRLLDDYFGLNGLRYNMIRVTIGGSDFSPRFYTNDDLDSEDGLASSPSDSDFSMRKFMLTEEDRLYKIPMLKQVLSKYKSIDGQEIKIFGSMWSPPIWMKTNNHFNGGSLKGGSSSPDYFTALASLKRSFLLAYKENSINFWGLTVMNEPYFAIEPFLNFNTMIFPAKDYATYISDYLGPILKDTPGFKDLQLFVHDDNRRYLMNYTDPVLNSPRVKNFVTGVATHGYVDEDYHLMDTIYEKHKPKTRSGNNFMILPTELCSGHLPFMEKALIGNWHRGVHYALDIIRSVQHSGSGWVDWNMALDTTGGPGWLGGRLDSPIIVDKQRDAYYKSPMYYAIGQFSRYVPAGSWKLDSKVTNNKFDNHFEVVSFLHPNNNTVILVALNNNPYQVQVNVRLTTSSGPDLGQYFALNCTENSLTTFLLPKKLGHNKY